MRKSAQAKQAEQSPVFVIDGGNADVKWICGSVKEYFPHALAELTQTQWEAAVSRYGNSDHMGFMMLDGKFYVVGPTAVNFNLTKRQRRAKYTRDYYGVLFANAVARTFSGDPSVLESLRVMASHAPGDFQLRNRLIDSVRGKWSFECGGISFKFSVQDVSTYDEQFGSYVMAAFVKKGSGYDCPLYGASVGLIDIGGGTNGYLVVNEDGQIDQTSSNSGTIGINNALQLMKDELEHSFPDFFGTNPPAANRLHQALVTGKYKGRGQTLDCPREAETALTPLLNEVKSAYIDKLGGGVSLDKLILTGGGSAILEQRLRQELDHSDISLATPADVIRFANVEGATKFLDVLETQI